MKYIDLAAAVLVLVGAINWGLVGLFQFNIVSTLFGDPATLGRLLYILVGVSGVFVAFQWKAIQDRWTA